MMIRILESGNLLAWVSINNAGGINAKSKHKLNFSFASTVKAASE